MAGPLHGLKVVEMAGIGPGPFACMLLSDLGADVIRVDRPGGGGLSAQGHPGDVLNRGRRSIAVDLKTAAGVDTVLQLIDRADVLIEGMRPGVMEKLGLGPELCLERNPGLVYGRMTGWGQDGPLSQAAGHDINYIAITGALDSIGRADGGPVPPLNLVGDFGGGGMYLVMGVLSALFEKNRSGKGQVVDAAISDGVISLMACIQGFKAMGMWNGEQRQSNMLDGAAHYYDTYECADGKWVAVGSIEPQFHAILMEKLGIDCGESSFAAQFDQAKWPTLKQQVATAFRGKTRAEWCAVFEGTDACFAPVLSVDEAPDYPHNKARASFVEIDGQLQTAPAPRFSRTAGKVGRAPVGPGADSVAILEEMGMTAEEIESLQRDRVVSGN